MSQLFLGCPVWSCDAWPGHFLSKQARKNEFLKEYASVFNTVEGNSTFYGLPSLHTVERWCADTPPTFRFCPKFPRSISHDRQLVGAESETAAFLERLRILQDANRLGPCFLQLSPTFDRTQFHSLEEYLRQIASADIPVAVEVRHADYFDLGETEAALNDLCRSLQFDRVLFDSRALFSKPPSDDSETAAQRRKPQSPFRQTVTGRHPFLRFVGRNKIEEALPWISEWAPTIVDWIRGGLSPYVLMHSPDDFLAPSLCRAMHQELLRLESSLTPVAPWPAESERQRDSRQKRLFE